MRRFTRIAALMATLAAIALTAPATASADTCTYATDRPSYTGWVSLVHPGCQPVRYSGTYEWFTAWRWTGSSWQAVSVSEGVVFYVWPFGSGYSWVWSQSTGWLAITSEHVLIRRSFTTCSWCTEWWLQGPR
jgi:hypothetical protein